MSWANLEPLEEDPADEFGDHSTKCECLRCRVERNEPGAAVEAQIEEDLEPIPEEDDRADL